MKPTVNKKYKNELYVTHDTMDNAIGYAIRACKTLQDLGDKTTMIVAIQSMLNTFIAEEEKRDNDRLRDVQR